MWSILLQVLRRLIISPKIGLVAYTAASSWNGIMSTTRSTFQCQSTSKKMQECHHIISRMRQTWRYSPASKKYGTEAWALLLPDSSPKLDKAGIKCDQQIVDGMLCYAHAMDMTVLMALSTIAAEQTIVTTKTIKICTKFKCKGAVPSFRHGLEHTLQCILFVSSKSTE